MEYDYRDPKKLADSYRVCMVCWIGALLMLLLIAVLGCRSQKTVERESSQDNTYTELRESIVYVPVTTVVEIPAQTAERQTRDSTSHLETAFALSDACITWRDGVPFLFHSLANKPQRIEQTQTVPVRQTRLTRYRFIRKTRYVYKHIEAQLSLWQCAVLSYSPWVILSLIIYIIYIRTRLRRQDS